MRVLVRKYDDKYYVWKNAIWHNGKYYVIDGDSKYEVSTVCILAVEDDERVGYVMCQSCGTLIKDDPESIEAHYAEQEANRDCLSCRHLRTANSKCNIHTSYERNNDGTYHITQTFDSTLNCHVGYWGYDINSDQAKGSCIYGACRRAGMGIIDDPFVRYPGLFEKHITVDMLTKKKYTNDGWSNGHFNYDLKCRGTLVACVNELGIINHFKLNYRSYVYHLYYSEAYDKLFYEKYGKYNEGTPWGIPESKMTQVKEKIAALYKEANK